MIESISRLFRPRERKEIPETEKNLYLPNFDVVVFSGFAGTGKTFAADLVNEAIIGTQFVKVGQRMREEYIDLFNIPEEKDFDVDEEQERLMRQTSNSFPLILESRLGPVIGADIVAKLGQDSPKIVRVLAVADETVRNRRVWERDRQSEPELTLEESIAQTQRRDAEFVQRMQTLYPRLLRDQHPFDPNITAIDGTRIYDLIIDTTFVPKDKVGDLFLRNLLERGLLKKIQRTDFGEGKAGEIAFDKIRKGSPCEYDGCQRLSTITVDSVTSDSIYSRGVCSESHGNLLEKEVTDELTVLRENGSSQNLPIVEFGRNGFAEVNATS